MRVSRHDRYCCRAPGGSGAVCARSPEEAEHIFEAQLDALEDGLTPPTAHIEGHVVDP